MKFVIQRCQEASVSVDGKTVGAIEKGLMVLIGVGKDDTTEVVDKYLKNYYSYGSLKMRTARQIVL